MLFYTHTKNCNHHATADIISISCKREKHIAFHLHTYTNTFDTFFEFLRRPRMGNTEFYSNLEETLKA